MKIILAFIISLITLYISGQNVYLNPASISVIEDGSMANPYKSFDKVTIKAGHTYLVNKGTTMKVSKKIFVRPANITIKTYGIGDRPIIVSSVSVKEKILDISLTSNFTIRDIELMSEDTALTVINIQGSPNTCIINCKLHEAYYGLRNIDSRNKVYVDSVEIFNIEEDGVYFNSADSVIIKNSNIHHVNQAYFKDATEQGSYGDAIQLDAAKYFYIGNNILDRSDTGNKFCFITGSGPCPGSVFEHNKCYGSPTLGAHMYIINTEGLIIRNNLFEGGARAIYGTGLNSVVSNNIFSGLTDRVFSQATRSTQTFSNNIFTNCNIALSSWSDILNVHDNVFYNVTIPFQGNNVRSTNNIFKTMNATTTQDSSEYYAAKIVDLNSQVSKLIDLYAAQKAAYDAVKPIVDVIILNAKIADQKALLLECYNIFLRSTISNSLKSEFRAKIFPYIQ
jgi:hypothetical protein